MAVPKSKISKRRGNTRYANWKLAPLNLVECPHCHELIKSHTACPKCGYYKERAAVDIKESNE